MQNKIKFSAAIIAKNEEKNILKAINSLKNICNQIIVVDTGSEDKTPQIVTQAGCELYFFKWKQDFAKARNFSIKFAKNEWIIILDADEEIDAGSINNNLEVFQNEKIGAVRVKIKNHIKDKDIVTEHKYPRIIRNIEGIAFTGKIHEQISESILNKGYEIVDSDIIIHHFGYSTDDTEKINRNLELLKDEINSNQKDDWKLFHLAETLFNAKKLDEAMTNYQSILNSVNLSEEQNDMVKIRLAQIYLSKNQFEKIPEFLNFTSQIKPLEGLRKYVLCSTLILQKKFDKAQILFNSIAEDEKNLLDHNELNNIKNLFELINKVI